MPKGMLFWVIYVLCVIFGGWFGYTGFGYYGLGCSLVVFVLIGILGWANFGPPVQ